MITRTANPGSNRAISAKWRVATLAAAVIAFCSALAITSGYGPGLHPDSMAYVGASRSLAEHGELRVPMGKWQTPDTSVTLTVWPPAFPIAIAAPQLLGASALTSARIVLALSAAITIGGALLLLSGAAPLSAAVFGAAVIAVTPSFVTDHISVLSEPLFLAFLTVSLLGMARQKIALAGFAAAGAVMTRYAGVSAGAAVAIWFFFETPGSIRLKLRRASIAAAPSAIAFLAWMAHNAGVKTVQSSLEISYYPGLSRTIRDGLTIFAGWLAPSASGAPSAIVASLVAALVVASMVTGTLRRRTGNPETRDSSSPEVKAAAVLVGCYLALIILSRTFVGGSIQFDERILSPIFLLIELMLIPLVVRAARQSRGAVRAGAVLLTVAWIIAAFSADAPVVADATQDGNDFAASDWRDSPTIAWVKTESQSRPIYTNWPAAIYFAAGRAAYDLPVTADPDTLRFFAATIASRNGVFVAFNARNPDYPPTDSLAAAAHLELLKRLPDGAVWVSGAQARSPSRSGDVAK